MTFSQRVLHGVLQSREEKLSNITTQCTKETCISRGNQEYVIKKIPAGKKIDLELLNQILGHRSKRSLLSRYTVNIWEDVDLRIYPDPFCTSCQIYSINKEARHKNPLEGCLWLEWNFRPSIFFIE